MTNTNFETLTSEFADYIENAPMSRYAGFEVRESVLHSDAFDKTEPHDELMSELGEFDTVDHDMDEPYMTVTGEYAVMRYSLTEGDVAALCNIDHDDEDALEEWVDENVLDITRALEERLSGFGYQVWTDFAGSMSVEFSSDPEAFGMTPDTVTIDAMANALVCRVSGAMSTLDSLLDTRLSLEVDGLDMSALEADENEDENDQ